MKYIIIIDSDLEPLKDVHPNLEKVFIELDDKGLVKREIGFDSDNHIIHACPSDNKLYGKYRRYGIFDLVMFDMSVIRDEISKEMFEKNWNNVEKKKRENSKKPSCMVWIIILLGVIIILYGVYHFLCK